MAQSGSILNPVADDIGSQGWFNDCSQEVEAYLGQKPHDEVAESAQESAQESARESEHGNSSESGETSSDSDEDSNTSGVESTPESTTAFRSSDTPMFPNEESNGEDADDSEYVPSEDNTQDRKTRNKDMLVSDDDD